MEAITTHENIKVNEQLPFLFAIHHSAEFTLIHWHEYLEIVILLEGEMYARVNGTAYSLKEGDMLYVNADEPHQTRQRSERITYLLIQISTAHLHNLFPAVEIPALINNCSKELLHEIPSITEIISSFKDIYEKQNKCWELELTGQMYRFLSLLFNSSLLRTGSLSETSADHERKRIIEVIQWMQSHYTEPLSLQDAANLFGSTREHFCRVFRKHTAQTFMEYLNMYRVSRFYSDMLAGTESLSELMHRNGLNNYRVFSKTFRKMYGDPPREIRRRYRKH